MEPTTPSRYFQKFLSHPVSIASSGWSDTHCDGSFNHPIRPGHVSSERVRLWRSASNVDSASLGFKTFAKFQFLPGKTCPLADQWSSHQKGKHFLPDRPPSKLPQISFLMMSKWNQHYDSRGFLNESICPRSRNAYHDDRAMSTDRHFLHFGAEVRTCCPS